MWWKLILAMVVVTMGLAWCEKQSDRPTQRTPAQEAQYQAVSASERRQAEARRKRRERERAKERRSEWRSHSSTDEFDDDTVVSAYPAMVTRGEPYRRAHLYVRCVNSRELDVFVVFDYLNLAYRSKVYGKFDAEKPIRLTESYSQDRTALFFQWEWSFSSEALARKLATSNMFTIRMTYHNYGQVDIKFDLTGSRKHVAKVMNACGKTVDE